MDPTCREDSSARQKEGWARRLPARYPGWAASGAVAMLITSQWPRVINSCQLSYTFSVGCLSFPASASARARVRFHRDVTSWPHGAKFACHVSRELSSIHADLM